MVKKFKKIYVEITNVCNLNCIFCPKTTRKPEFIKLNFFNKILGEVKPLCDEITLHIMGEPLLHSDFKSIILECEKNDVKINLTTNGTFIKDQDILMNKTIRRINFSLQGIDSNLDKEKIEKYLLDIINFTKLAQEKNSELLIIYRLWNIGASTKESNIQILNFIEKEFDVKIENFEGKKSVKVKDNCFIHYDYSFDWPNENNPIRTDKGYCHGLSTHIGILVDGTVVPCCLDNEGKIPLGNIKNNSLINILESKKVKDMYAGFKGRKLTDSLCKKCTYIKRFDK